MEEDVKRHSVDVANDILDLLQYTNYMVQIVLNPEGTYVKAGDANKKVAALVNIDLHRKPNSNIVQDKILAFKLAARLILQLKRA